MIESRPARRAVAVLLVLTSTPAAGDVTLDDTLKAGNSSIDLDAGDPGNYVIDEAVGIRAGSNLFHSFGEFGLADGESAQFTGDPGIKNVISRVTGNVESIIEGVVRSDVGSDNFLFVNPSGITFRNIRENDPQSKVSVPGSFYASTADQLLFSGGEVFDSNGVSGTTPANILSVPEAWNFLGGNVAEISVDQTLPLRVQQGETLSLVGGDVFVQRGATIEANGGAIQIAAVGSDAARVPLDLESWQIPDSPLGEIIVEAGDSTGGSILRTNGQIGGGIVMRGGRLVVRDNAQLLTTGDASLGTTAVDLAFSERIALDNGFVSAVNGTPSGVGAIQVQSNVLSISNGGAIRQVTGNGNAGNLTVTADEIRLVDGGVIESSAAVGLGRGGDLIVSAGNVELSSNATIRTFSGSTGRAGDLTIAADESIQLRDSSGIGSQAFAAGRAGDVTVAAVDAIDLAGNSEISSANESDSTGAGGNVTIAGSLDGSVATGQLRISDGAQIEVTTVTDQSGGDLTVVADQIEIEGSTVASGRISGLFARSGRDPVAVGAGDGGSLRIESQTLELHGAAEISVRSFGAGQSGTLAVVAAESVVLQGTPTAAPNLSIRVIDGDAGGVATSEPGLIVRTERLELRDGALISASTLGGGEAGDVLVDAGSVLVRGESNGIGSSLFAESAGRSSGAGGSGRIELVVRDDLEVADGGRISVRTQGPGASDRIDVEVGGDLSISGDSVVRSLAEGSGAAGDIVLDAGGSITIETGASVTAESLGSSDAGDVQIRAGRGIDVRGARVATASNEGGGGNIQLTASRSIRLVEGTVLASARGREGEGDAGNVDFAANEITVNDSAILAQATLGDGGRIQIVADRYLASAESLIDASSSAGIDGLVVVDAPDTSLRGDLARLPSVIVDPSVLLRAPCAARASGRGSFLVLGSEGAPQTPLEAGSLPMPLPATPDTSSPSAFPPGQRPGGSTSGWDRQDRTPADGTEFAPFPSPCERLIGEQP